MPEMRTSEWRELCFQAASEIEPERRIAIIAELRRILHNDIRKCGPVWIDLGKAQVTRDGEPIYLTHLEWQLLRHLIERAGRSVSREELLRSVWGYDSGTLTRTLDAHVHRLRRKLEDTKRPKLIVTVPRMGYKFIA